jgi:hypothetical protein
MLSDKYVLAEHKLGEPLAAWLRGHRADSMSWRWIAIELARLTDVHVTDVTLAQWMKDTSHSVTYQVDPFDLMR